MESSQDISELERQNEDLGKGDYSESTNTSTLEGENSKRTRNSDGKRNFICACSKAYLSWAAFYTHVKNKHGGEVPKKSVIYQPVSTQRQFTILGKSNRHAITMAGNTATQNKTVEAEPVVPEMRRFLKSVKLYHQASEVNKFPYTETLHESSASSRNISYKRFPSRIRI